MKTAAITVSLTLVLALLPRAGAAQSTNVLQIAEGARLWGQTCIRCHVARSPSERTDREWVTIVNHMRARANLSRSQAQAMIAFLQSANAPESAAAAAASPTAAQEPLAPGDPRVESGSDGDVQSPRRSAVVVDLADPRLAPQLRLALERYLRGIGND